MHANDFNQHWLALHIKMMNFRLFRCCQSVEKTERSDNSIVNRASKYGNTGIDRTVPPPAVSSPADIEKKRAAVKWADLVMRNAGSTASTRREAANQTRNKLFRERIILSKQSSVKV